MQRPERHRVCPRADARHVGRRECGRHSGRHVAHVHIGCTLGNFPLPTAVDDQGRFSADGNYTLRAYPIAVGPELPAVFTGVVNGNLLTLSVAVDDTVEKKLVPLGPVTVVLGREPRMQTCPICRSIAKPLMGHPLTALLRPAT